ncbi:MAG: serine/threonine-protein kinase [Pseudomonadota bacterium]
MLNWKKITEAAEHAGTLHADMRDEFLASACNDSEQLAAANRLMARTAPAGFMRTSLPDADDAPQPALAEGQQVGPWRIDTLIGRGGMGEVYRAERADGRYEQTVALKLMQGAAPSDSFDAERRRLALMEHPGIARIVDGGETDDHRPYMAMEYVDGAPIDAYVRDAQLGRSERLALFRRVCQAVRHAHNKLILHRDLKSQNILVDSRGQPRLIDFGIASSLEDNAEGAGPLTLAWAAPEQLRGEALSAQTDVFALGILLHLLISDMRPEREPDGGMSIRINDDADLAAITRRALATEPGERYGSVDALAEDVGNWLEKRPVLAREGGRLYRLGKLIKRAPLATALAAAFIVALTGGLAASLTFADAARQEAERATDALERRQYQWERTEATLAAQQAYSDVLQRAFGGDEDSERLSKLMMTRWREVFDNRDEDPNAAAATSYAIGRNFYFRRDLKRALEVFDAWMPTGAGNPALYDIGEEVYALMLTDAGRDAEAEPILRELVARFSTGYQESESELFNYAFKLARITKAEEDLALAEELVTKLIANDTQPFELLFHTNMQAFLRNARDDRQGGYESFKRTLQLFDENPNLVVYGRDTVRYNVASMELSFTRDLDRAQTIAQQIIDEDVPMKGESSAEARARLVLGLVAMERGDNDVSLNELKRADSLFEQYEGSGSPWHIKGLAVLAVAQANAGDVEAADATLAAARVLVDEVNGSATRGHQLLMAQVHVDLIAARVDAVPADAFADPEFLDVARGDTMQLYLYQRLAEADLVPPLPKREAT